MWQNSLCYHRWRLAPGRGAGACCVWGANGVEWAQRRHLIPDFQFAVRPSLQSGFSRAAAGGRRR